MDDVTVKITYPDAVHLLIPGVIGARRCLWRSVFVSSHCLQGIVPSLQDEVNSQNQDERDFIQLHSTYTTHSTAHPLKHINIQHTMVQIGR